MLVTLSIEQFAIIDQVTIDFQAGMTVLSGETGAGKSIIIDALGLLCGGRGSSDYIRHGADRLVIQGLFSFESWPQALAQDLENLGISLDPETCDLILRREITQAGKNIIRINGHLANVTSLKTIGAYLVDIHGQHEHQSLLDTSQHLPYLDAYGQIRQSSTWLRYQEAYETYRDLRQAWLEAQENESQQLQRVDFLEFQLEELEAADLIPGEAEELEARSRQLQNSQALAQAVGEINYLLNDSETSILTQVSQVIDRLQGVATYHEAYPNLVQSLEGLQIDLQEIGHELALSDPMLDDSDQSIDEVESRLNELGQLTRKYGRSIEELLDYQEEISEEIYQIRHRERYLEDLEGQLQATYQETWDLAQALSAQRQGLSQDLTQAVEGELEDLYMQESRFEIDLQAASKEDLALAQVLDDPVVFDSTGFDQAEFYIQTNLGEPLSPLVKVASGGELSRLILALKTVFSRLGTLKTMVFDEIDTGVSGRVGQAIAEKIHAIADQHQVLCITHLPSVAAIADQQLLIEKSTQSDHTYSSVQALNFDQRVEVIASMMSGPSLSHNAKKVAQELLTSSPSYSVRR